MRDEIKETAAAKVLREARTHRSDCAIYDAPALPARDCDCGVEKRKTKAAPAPPEGE